MAPFLTLPRLLLVVLAILLLDWARAVADAALASPGPGAGQLLHGPLAWNLLLTTAGIWAARLALPLILRLGGADRDNPQPTLRFVIGFFLVGALVTFPRDYEAHWRELLLMFLAVVLLTTMPTARGSFPDTPAMRPPGAPILPGRPGTVVPWWPTALCLAVAAYLLWSDLLPEEFALLLGVALGMGVLVMLLLSRRWARLAARGAEKGASASAPASGTDVLSAGLPGRRERFAYRPGTFAKKR